MRAGSAWLGLARWVQLSAIVAAVATVIMLYLFIAAERDWPPLDDVSPATATATPQADVLTSSPIPGASTPTPTGSSAAPSPTPSPPFRLDESVVPSLNESDATQVPEIASFRMVNSSRDDVLLVDGYGCLRQGETRRPFRLLQRLQVVRAGDDHYPRFVYDPPLPLPNPAATVPPSPSAPPQAPSSTQLGFYFVLTYQRAGDPESRIVVGKWTRVSLPPVNETSERPASESGQARC